MSEFDAESYAAAWRERNKNEKARIKARMSSALNEAKRLSKILTDKAGIEKVILFGSLAENTVRDENFDIDLAISGGSRIKAQEIIEKSPFKVDILEYEDAPAHIRKRIDENGVLLQPEKVK